MTGIGATAAALIGTGTASTSTAVIGSGQGVIVVFVDNLYIGKVIYAKGDGLGAIGIGGIGRDGFSFGFAEVGDSVIVAFGFLSKIGDGNPNL